MRRLLHHKQKRAQGTHSAAGHTTPPRPRNHEIQLAAVTFRRCQRGALSLPCTFPKSWYVLGIPIPVWECTVVPASHSSMLTCCSSKACGLQE